MGAIVSRKKKRKPAKKKRKKSAKLRRLVRALKMAAPWVVLARWENFSHCIEMSHAGVAWLRKSGVQANVLLCAVVAQTFDGSTGMVVGHNLRSLYDFYTRYHELPDFDEWVKTQDHTLTSPDEPYPFHMVIEAKHQGDRAMIDLTSGQIFEASGEQIKMPLAVSSFGPDWPEYELDGAAVKYMECPHPDKVEAVHLTHPIPNNAGVTDDLEYLSETALRASSVEVFNRTIMASLRAQGLGELPQTVSDPDT